MRVRDETDLRTITFDSRGLVPVISQHVGTGEVLMLGYANDEALRRTLSSGEMWYYSRSRARLWRKGETSGNVQRLNSLSFDCDADTILALVEPSGPTCHTGEWSCFDSPPFLAGLDRIIASRAANPESGGYTRRLLEDANLRAKKLGEEAVELAIAACDGGQSAVAEEAADLIYHTLVVARAAGVDLADIARVLGRRRATGD